MRVYWFLFLFNLLMGLYICDNCVVKFVIFQQFSVFYQMFEVIGYGFGGDSVFYVFDDQVCGFELLYVVQYYFCGQDDGVWVYFVLVGIFWCSIVSCFEQCVFVIDVGVWGDIDIVNLCCQGVRDIVVVQVYIGDNVVFCWMQQDLLQECIGDYVFYYDFFVGVWVFDFYLWIVVDQFVVEFFVSQLVVLVFECVFGEFYDVVFVYQSDGIMIVGDCVFNCGVYQVFGVFFRVWFDVDVVMFWEVNFFYVYFIVQEFDYFVCFCRVGFLFDICIDIF